MISGRFTVGWYFSRGLSVLVSAIVLIVMLGETFVLNTKLMRMSMLLQRERNNKLAKIDVAVGAIAHEVRQPLTAIALQAAAAAMACSAPPDLGKARGSLERIVDATKRERRIRDNPEFVHKLRYRKAAG